MGGVGDPVEIAMRCSSDALVRKPKMVDGFSSDCKVSHKDPMRLCGSVQDTEPTNCQ